MNRIVAIGGTGQLVLHYYLQLYLTGAIREPFDAFVIDSDEPIPSLQTLADFFGLLHLSSNSTTVQEAVPRLEFLKVAPRGSTAFEVLSGQPELPSSFRHPAQAFFDDETLRQEIRYGLFARPTLSAALAVDDLTDAILAPEGERIVVVGSVIGGTGGGLIGPALAKLRQRARETNRTVSLRGVFVGEWFKPSPGVVGGDERRFQSNAVATMASIKAAIDEIHSYAFLEREQFLDLPEKIDEKTRSMQWPGKGHPLWAAEQHLHDRLTDTVQQINADIESRRISRIPQKINFSHADKCRNRALSLVQAAVDHSVVALVANEPFSLVWGRALRGFIAHFWSLANRHDLEGGEVPFPRLLQSEVDALWRGRSGVGPDGLKAVFPETRRHAQVKPVHFKRAGLRRYDRTWQLDPMDFPDVTTTAQRAAAGLVFSLLRSGGAQ